eukprot:UN30819
MIILWHWLGHKFVIVLWILVVWLEIWWIVGHIWIHWISMRKYLDNLSVLTLNKLWHHWHRLKFIRIWYLTVHMIEIIVRKRSSHWMYIRLLFVLISGYLSMMIIHVLIIIILVRMLLLMLLYVVILRWSLLSMIWVIIVILHIKMFVSFFMIILIILSLVIFFPLLIILTNIFCIMISEPVRKS